MCKLCAYHANTSRIKQLARKAMQAVRDPSQMPALMAQTVGMNPETVKTLSNALTSAPADAKQIMNNLQRYLFVFCIKGNMKFCYEIAVPLVEAIITEGAATGALIDAVVQAMEKDPSKVASMFQKIIIPSFHHKTVGWDQVYGPAILSLLQTIFGKDMTLDTFYKMDPTTMKKVVRKRFGMDKEAARVVGDSQSAPNDITGVANESMAAAAFRHPSAGAYSRPYAPPSFSGAYARPRPRPQRHHCLYCQSHLAPEEPARKQAKNKRRASAKPANKKKKTSNRRSGKQKRRGTGRR